LGPLLVAWIAGDALRPPISLLFGVLVIVTLLASAASFLVKSGPTRDRKTDAAALHREIHDFGKVLQFCRSSKCAVVRAGIAPTGGFSRKLDQPHRRHDL
jgi:hypothetical protein